MALAFALLEPRSQAAWEERTRLSISKFKGRLCMCTYLIINEVVIGLPGSREMGSGQGQFSMHMCVHYLYFLPDQYPHIS